LKVLASLLKTVDITQVTYTAINWDVGRGWMNITKLEIDGIVNLTSSQPLLAQGLE
jgi:hypothetical protein